MTLVSVGPGDVPVPKATHYAPSLSGTGEISLVPSGGGVEPGRRAGAPDFLCPWEFTGPVSTGHTPTDAQTWNGPSYQ